MHVTAHCHQDQALIDHGEGEKMKLHSLNDLHIEFEDFTPPATGRC
jgi:hypothetical protein